MTLITYQKKDGSILKRYRNTELPYKIGDKTSMGWLVLNVEYEYNNKFYDKHQYNRLLNKKKQMCIKKKLVRELYIKELKALLYYILAALLVNFVKMMLGL